MVKIGGFLCNMSALYRGAFFIWVKKGYCFCLYLNNEMGGFVLKTACEVTRGRRAEIKGCRAEKGQV